MLCNLLSDQISICTLEDNSDDNNKDTGRVYTCNNLWCLFYLFIIQVFLERSFVLFGRSR